MYYKGAYFKYVKPTTGSASVGTDGYCVSDINDPSCPGGVPAPRITNVRLTCIKVNSLTGERVHVSYGACPSKIKRCDSNCGENIPVGNPVEVPSLAKIVSDFDWASPIEPRFSVDRFYRSDRRLVETFETTVNSPRDILAGVWQFGTQDWLIGTQRNPNSPSDTAYYWLLKSAAGMSAMFKSTDVSQTIGYAGGLRMTQNTYALAEFTSSTGVVSQFTRVAGGANPLSSRTWPDGYKITLTRTGSPAVQLSRMADNRGNIADFIYDNNVVPGANRPLVKEVVLSRNTTGTEVAFGKIVYTYQVLDYRWGIDGASSTPLTRRPVVSAVDYVDLATTVATPLHRYFYSTGLVNDELAYPPLLTSISNGQVDGSGNPVPFAEYTYKYDSEVELSGAAGYRVETTKFKGDGQSRHYGLPGSLSVEETNTYGLTKTYAFQREVLGNDTPLKLTTLTTAAIGNVLATSTSYSYDASGPIGSVTLPNGSVTEYQRNSRGLVTRMVEASGTPEARTTDFTWHATLGLPLTRTDDRTLASYNYDSNGLPTSFSLTDQVATSPTHGQTRTWGFGYTTLANGMKALTTLDGPGLSAEGVDDVTTFTYSAKGDLLTSTDPNGLVTTVLSRNAIGLPTSIEEPDGNLWTFAYDRDGRIVSSSLSAPGATPVPSGYTYNLAGQLVTYTNAHGKIWTFAYSDARRLTAVVGPEGDTVTYGYDSAGNVITEQYSAGSNPATFWEETEFDALGRLAQTYGAMGQNFGIRYDKMNNPVQEIDPLTYVTGRSFDVFDRMTQLVEKGTATSGFGYDTSDNLTSYSDPRGLVTTYTRNGFGDVVQEAGPDRGTITYSLDRRGLVTTQTDARGVTIGYSYDDGGRLVQIDYPASTLPDVTFTWDQAFLGVPVDANKGKIGKVDDGVLSLTFGHELTATGSRVTTLATYPGARNYTVVEDRDYDGFVTRVVYPSGLEVHHDQDDAGRISAIRLKTGATWTNVFEDVAYAPNGPQTSAVFGDGFSQTRTYDSSYRLTGLRDTDLTTVLRDASFGYEARDNLTSVTDTLVPANSEAFGYSPREELASASGAYGPLAYSYDTVGNRLTQSSGSLTDTYAYPLGSNRLSGVAVGSGGSRAFTYDAAGNVLSEVAGTTTKEFVYNAAGRLASFKSGGVVQATYLYDAMGRQAVRSLTAGPVTIHSVFDSEGRRIAEYNEATGALIREYVWNAWEPVAVVEGGAVYLVRTDHIGRPVFATDLTGAVVWSASYQPFGGVTVTTGSPIDARFPGQWFQAESGLHQNWMRDYDPTLGRYLQPDPLGLVDGPSIYGYARQNPEKFTDRTGSQTLPIPGVGQIGGPFFPMSVAPGTPYGDRLGQSFRDDILPLFDPRPLLQACRNAVCGAFAVCDTDQTAEEILLNGAVPGKKTRGRSENWEKEGGYDAAIEDFGKAVDPGSVEPMPEDIGGMRGRTKEGNTINVRPKSSYGGATVEVQRPDGSRLKVRY